MTNTTSEPPPKKTTKKGPAKGYRHPSTPKYRRTPAGRDMISLREAHGLLRHLPGYHSHESTRVRIIVDKELPSERVGKRGDIWVLRSAVHEMAGKYKNELAPPIPLETEDQRLLKHYSESETNNYITAVTAGLASTLAHAKHVYEEFRAAKSDPIILAIETKKALEARLAQPETRCRTCDRTEQLAKEDDARVVRGVTGGRDMLEMIEENALSEYQNNRCKECWYWRPHAPIAQMCKRLLEYSPPAPAPASPETPDQTAPKTT
jgi:hypothetical protein